MAKSNNNLNIPNASVHDLSERDVGGGIVPEYAQSVDGAVERQVVRKFDLTLMPLMWIGNGLVFYDKV